MGIIFFIWFDVILNVEYFCSLLIEMNYWGDFLLVEEYLVFYKIFVGGWGGGG